MQWLSVAETTDYRIFLQRSWCGSCQRKYMAKMRREQHIQAMPRVVITRNAVRVNPTAMRRKTNHHPSDNVLFAALFVSTRITLQQPIPASLPAIFVMRVISVLGAVHIARNAIGRRALIVSCHVTVVELATTARTAFQLVMGSASSASNLRQQRILQQRQKESSRRCNEETK